MNRRKFAKLLSLLPVALGLGCYSTKEGCQSAEAERWKCLIYRPGQGKAFPGVLRDLRRGDAFLVASEWHPDCGTWFLATSDQFVSPEGNYGIEVKEILRPRERQSAPS